MLPAGKPLKTNLDVAATDMSKLLIELKAREFNGYVTITVKGTLGVEEGTTLFEKGKIIGCAYEYYKHGKTVGGQKAFQRVLNATAANTGVIDIYSLEPEQVELTLAFNETLVFVPNTSDLRKVKVDKFSPDYEQEIVKEIEAEKKVVTPLTQENELTKKYKLAGLKKEDKT